MSNLLAIFNELCMSFNEQKVNATIANFCVHDHYENPELFAYLLTLDVKCIRKLDFYKGSSLSSLLCLFSNSAVIAYVNLSIPTYAKCADLP